MAIDFSFGNRKQAFSGAATASPQAALQALFLDRLARLVRKVHLHGRYLVPTDRRMQLLNRAILTTFCDCREAGVEAEARAILTDLRRDLVLPVPAPDNPAL